jgi:hypothetical protein
VTRMGVITPPGLRAPAITLCTLFAGKARKVRTKKRDLQSNVIESKLVGGCEIGLTKIIREVSARPAGITSASKTVDTTGAYITWAGWPLPTSNHGGAFVSGMIHTGPSARARSASHTAAAFMLFL